MQKIDYGDINKFLVSIGLAILSPYFYLKEDFGINIDSEQILKFDEPVKQFISNKQNQVIAIQKIIPWTSLSLIIIGLISMIVGLVRWFKRQAKIDEKFDKEIQKLDLEIETLTPEEKVEKAKQEVEEIELAEKLETIQTPNMTNKPYLDYMKIEQSLYSRFQNLNSPNFEIFSEQKLGNRFYIDLLLKANSKKFSDRIIEIKYFKNQLPISSFKKAIHQLNTYLSYYKKTTNKLVLPVLLIVYKEENITDRKIENIRKQIAEFSIDIPNMSRLKVEFIKENELEIFDIGKLLKK
jgi:hypothetical protein